MKVHADDYGHDFICYECGWVGAQLEPIDMEEDDLQDLFGEYDLEDLLCCPNCGSFVEVSDRP